jgi:Bax protein
MGDQVQLNNAHSDKVDQSEAGADKQNYFERGVLSLVGLCVIMLIFAAWFNPPDSGSISLHGPIIKAEPLILSTSLLPGQVTSVPIDELSEISVAARPVGSSAKALHKTFTRLGYQLDKIKSDNKPVPRVFLTSLPVDLSQVPENKKRKAIFFKALLPLVLQVNEEILNDRRQLWKLRYQTALGEKPDAADRLWLRVMTERYKVKSGDIDALFSRIDIVPTSLALAQAAEESGWGASRFAREGNAMFGQWTRATSKGLVPLKRDAGKSHKVKSFETLIDSVRAYALNLNSHRAYKGFRRTRQSTRRAGSAIDGRVLAGKLHKYSERGVDYVISLRNLIDRNGLGLLDGARLDIGASAALI